VHVGIKFNFSEFIVIFDTQIFDIWFFFMKDCSIGTIIWRKQQSYCDFFSCDFFSCDFLYCDFFSVYRIVNSWIWLLLILHERTIPILLSFINRYFSQIILTNRIYLFNSAEYLTASKTVACKQVQNFRPPWLFDFQDFYQSTKTGKIFSKKCVSGTNSKIE
jgi:hypothetical protein